MKTKTCGSLSRARPVSTVVSLGTASALIAGSMLLAGCAFTSKFVSFPSITPAAKLALQGALTAPQGAGPFAAVVVLHGCFGIFSRDEAWAARLASWGYVSLLVDSFGSRGERSICDDESRVPSFIRADDAHAAMAYLRSLPFVRKDRIAVIGWGHGAQTTLFASSKSLTQRAKVSGFRAAVAYYPFCSVISPGDLDVPLLVLIGERDPLTPAHLCQGLANAGAVVQVYPGAVHGFDLPDRIYGGPIAYDPAAAEDSERRVKDFLAGHLR